MRRISSAASSSLWGSAQGGATPTTPRIAYLYLAIVVVTWAGNWPLMKLAIGGMPPFLFVLYRLVGSIAVLTPALIACGIPLVPARGERLALMSVGAAASRRFSDMRYIRLGACASGPSHRSRLHNAALGDPDRCLVVARAGWTLSACWRRHRICRPYSVYEPGSRRLGELENASRQWVAGPLCDLLGTGLLSLPPAHMALPPLDPDFLAIRCKHCSSCGAAAEHDQ